MSKKYYANAHKLYQRRALAKFNMQQKFGSIETFWSKHSVLDIIIILKCSWSELNLFDRKVAEENESRHFQPPLEAIDDRLLRG
jgi:hypothetical protein